MTSWTATTASDLPVERKSKPDASIVSTLGTEPWKSPWWKASRGDVPTFYYVVTIHILAAIGLVFFATPGWPVIAATVGLAWLGGMGVTICYHRSLAHTSLRLHPIVKHILGEHLNEAKKAAMTPTKFARRDALKQLRTELVDAADDLGAL